MVVRASFFLLTIHHKCLIKKTFVLLHFLLSELLDHRKRVSAILGMNEARRKGQGRSAEATLPSELSLSICGPAPFTLPMADAPHRLCL
jgi:hypothetical protein